MTTKAAMTRTERSAAASRPARRPGQAQERSAAALRITALAIACVLAATGLALGNGRPLAQAALAGDGPEAAAAIANLRRAGQAGVELLLAEAPPPDAVAARAHWSRVLDAVCAQRDCAASGLFWHTDFEQALAAAERSGRPILSLRLLGRLDQEASCANSRFFRTALYPDPRVASLLRERFVLHWQSVRPVPRLTIDFGDGRTLEGTITGNSIHYVLDPHGRLVDALPGLYGPRAFVASLDRAGRAALDLASRRDDAFAVLLAAYHSGRLADLDLELRPEGGLAAVPSRWESANGGEGPPTAREAMVLATTKMRVEEPVVAGFSRGAFAGGPDGAEAVYWELLATERRAEWELSEESRRLLLAKHRPADPADGERVIAEFERLVGIDTVRNEYLLHATLHRWLAAYAPGPLDLAEFNQRVYAELFLTPSSDPWLGLVSPETYLALEPGFAPEPAPAPERVAGAEPSASRSSAATIRRADGALR